MAKGIIYVMTTVVPGLLKIGKTGSDNFEQRMSHLERNGYANVTGLKRRFAIEVEDYDEKEKLLDEIFNKSKVFNTELYALDLNLVIRLLSSFEGRQVYPEEKTKDEVFDDAVKEEEDREEERAELSFIPDGFYYIKDRKVNGFPVEGRVQVKDGIFRVLQGSICAPAHSEWQTAARKNAWIENNVLMEDVECASPSTAGNIIIGTTNNGWTEWKDEQGHPIDVYRKK